jgi:hypothetical protein
MSQQQLFKILFDSQTSQVEQQALTGTRLNTLFGALTSVFGVEGIGDAWPGGAQNPLAFTPVATGTYQPVTRADLDEAVVLASLTRWNFDTQRNAAYTDQELTDIVGWVSGGGGLLLMSNHTYWAQHDQALAESLGFHLHHDQMISVPGGMMEMSGGDFYPSGPAGVGQVFSGVTEVVAHDGCGISFDVPIASGIQYAPLIGFPAAASAPSGQYFAACAQYNAGKVVVVANSGFPADVGNGYPAAGMAPYASNLLFVLNAFSWLAGIPAWNPATGFPPNGG